MRKYSRPALAYIGSLATVTAGMSALSALAQPKFELESALICVALAALSGASHLYPVRSPQGGAIYVLANIFLFAAVVELPPAWLSLTCVLSLVPVTIHNRQRPGALVNALFNMAQTILAAQAAHALIWRTGAQHLSGPVDLLWLLVAMAVFHGVQTLLVALVISLNAGVPLRRVEVLQLDSILGDAMMLFLGATLAVLGRANPWAVALLPVPVWIAFRLMHGVQTSRLAEIEPKTGLYNDRFFQRALAAAVDKSRRASRPLALVFADMDYLRDINNSYGHLAGDLVIKGVATVIGRHLRPGDIAARFGGEEFVVLLPGTNKEEAVRIGERLRAAVAGEPFDVGRHEPIHCTLSLGVAALPDDGATGQEILQRADEATYEAKAAGRNRVCTVRPGAKRGPRVAGPPERCAVKQASGRGE